MEGVQQKQAAKVRLAFQAVDPDGTGCAEAEVRSDLSDDLSCPYAFLV